MRAIAVRSLFFVLALTCVSGVGEAGACVLESAVDPVGILRRAGVDVEPITGRTRLDDEDAITLSASLRDDLNETQPVVAVKVAYTSKDQRIRNRLAWLVGYRFPLDEADADTGDRAAQGALVVDANTGRLLDASHEWPN